MYYPKSQIKTGLYTNGNEYQTSTNIPYVGDYWRTSSGEVFSGKGPQDPSSFQLFTLVSSKSKSSDFNLKINTTNLTPEVLGYFDVKGISVKNPPLSKTPQYSLTIPSKDDYLNGFYTRYFAKQSNRNIYIEIDETTFKSLNSGDENYDYKLYNTFKLYWVISGESEEEVSQQNYDLVEYYEKEKKYSMLTEYFTNYAAFYKP